MVKYPFDVPSVFILLFSRAQKKIQLVSLAGNAQGSFPTSFAHFKQLIHHLLLTLHVPREQNDHSRASSLAPELMLLSK